MILAGTKMIDQVYRCDAEVLSVDRAARTCVCRLITGKTQIEVPDVRLMTSVDDGFLIIPTIGSSVNIVFSNYSESCILQYSEVDEIIMRGGDLGGLIKIADMVTRINNIENKVNSIISTYNSHSHPGSGAPPSSTVSGTLSLTNRSQIENTKVTHG